jgi:hypothetical protein
MPSLIRSDLISCAEFQQRLRFALDNYADFCRTIKADQHMNRPIDWLDHFQEFLTLVELERRK